jgi:2-dehydro-3-deoxyphosphooctonate aldolase (KDO 8-P synthase)
MILFIGPCVIEDEGFVLEVAQEIKKQTENLGLDVYFKASFDKANRTSIESFRGPGMTKGLEVLKKVKSKTTLKLLTDFHSPEQADPVAEVVDVLQVPAFLCRQTEMIVAAATSAAKYGKKVNVKKGQFLAPWDTKNIVQKFESVWKENKSIQDLTLTERGVSFGYNRLVVDMISFQVMKGFGVKTIFDATHSVQAPGAGGDGKTTGGYREFIEVQARAAIAAGADGIFMEVHPNPKLAKSDGPNAFYLDKVPGFLNQLIAIRNVVKDYK